MLKAQVKEFTEDDEKVLGLEDGGHVTLECSCCGEGLAQVFITRPKAIDPATGEVFEWKVKAKCCYCGDQSYVKEIKGKYHLSGYGKIKADDATQDIPLTFIDRIEEEGDISVFYTVKAK